VPLREQRREQRLKSLEAGFDTCFSGANTDRVAKKAEQGRQRQNPLQLLHKKQQQRQSALQKPEPQQQQQQPPWRPGGNNDGGARRGWQQNTVVLAGQGGEQLKVRPKRSPALPAADAALGDDSELAQVAAAVRAAVAAAAAGPSTMSAEQREAAALDTAAERYEQYRSDDGGSGDGEDEDEDKDEDEDDEDSDEDEDEEEDKDDDVDDDKVEPRQALPPHKMTTWTMMSTTMTVMTAVMSTRTARTRTRIDRLGWASGRCCGRYINTFFMCLSCHKSCPRRVRHLNKMQVASPMMCR
jgi:hypothetical protein